MEKEEKDKSSLSKEFSKMKPRKDKDEIGTTFFVFTTMILTIIVLVLIVRYGGASKNDSSQICIPKTYSGIWLPLEKNNSKIAVVLDISDPEQRNIANQLEKFFIQLNQQEGTK